MAPALTYDEALAYLAQFINYETRQPYPMPRNILMYRPLPNFYRR